MSRSGRAIHWAEAFGLSAAVHVGVVFFALDFINDIRFIPDAEDQRPDLLVTSLVLDADTLAAATMTAPDSAAGSTEAPDPLAPDEVPPEDTLTAIEPEPDVAPEPEPEAAEDPEAPPETPDTAEAVEPEKVTPEEVAPAEIAETAPEAAIPDAVTPEPALAPEPLAPVAEAAVAPDALSPLRPQNDTLAAVAPSPGLSPGATALAPVSPSVAPVTLAPSVATAVTTVAPRETRPALPPAPIAARPATPPPPPGSPQAVVAELVAKIRASVGQPCLIALPRQAADGAPELVLLSSSETAIAELATELLDGVDPPPGQSSVLIDDRQCAALNYVRENPAYPAFRLTAGLATDQLSGQAQLQGAIGRAGGNYVSLLLIDDNGVVQDLNDYLTFAAGEARFDVPMRRAGNPRDTQPLLLAIASTTRPATLNIQNGQLAETYFNALRGELGINAPLVLMPFDLR